MVADDIVETIETSSLSPIKIGIKWRTRQTTAALTPIIQKRYTTPFWNHLFQANHHKYESSSFPLPPSPSVINCGLSLINCNAALPPSPPPPATSCGLLQPLALLPLSTCFGRFFNYCNASPLLRATSCSFFYYLRCVFLSHLFHYLHYLQSNF